MGVDQEKNFAQADKELKALGLRDDAVSSLINSARTLAQVTYGVVWEEEEVPPLNADGTMKLNLEEGPRLRTVFEEKFYNELLKIWHW